MYWLLPSVSLSMFLMQVLGTHFVVVGGPFGRLVFWPMIVCGARIFGCGFAAIFPVLMLYSPPSGKPSKILEYILQWALMMIAAYLAELFANSLSDFGLLRDRAQYVFWAMAGMLSILDLFKRATIADLPSHGVRIEVVSTIGLTWMLMWKLMQWARLEILRQARWRSYWFDPRWVLVPSYILGMGSVSYFSSTLENVVPKNWADLMIVPIIFCQLLGSSLLGFLILYAFASYLQRRDRNRGVWSNF